MNVHELFTTYATNTVNNINQVSVLIGGEKYSIFVMLGIFVFVLWLMKQRIQGWLFIVIIALLLTLFATGAVNV